MSDLKQAEFELAVLELINKYVSDGLTKPELIDAMKSCLKTCEYS